ncbi:MAG: HAMP domain-containing histidine kinase [Bacteroidetes bacterium]|nr:HAMP domain-containing histidine kinase [Bacteroidota bacterium]MBI3482096.1 HAMP domain-containing histidine kinase [Bacteroidota bacterium]
MQFFSRYSFIWKFPKEQELAYSRFVQPANLLSLRLVTFITLFGMTTFLIIDYFRDVDFSIVLVSRICVLSIASGLMAFTFKKPLSPNFIPWGIVIIGFINFSAALVTATYARMPGFYLTNLLFLIWVLVVAASGLNLRHGLLLNIILLLVFLGYSQLVNRQPFYFSQYPHLFVSFIYFTLVSIVLEYRRRKSFLQFSELTEQKRLVEDLNQQKNKIISILSHDVASPLNTLSGLLHLQAKGQISENEFRPFLTQIGDQLHNVTGLLHGLVRWSRSQMEGFVSQQKPVDFVKHLDELVKLFQPSASEKNISIKLKAEPNLVIYADEEMIRIAVRSLISNAIKFATPKSEISIQSFLNEETIILRISNKGTPIPEIHREKLFTYKMPSTEGTKGERGTGLGLAMAAFFVRFNGGEIFLEPSGNSHLTEFRIELPTSEEQSLDRSMKYRQAFGVSKS